MSGRPDDRAGTRPGRRGRDVVGAVAWAPRQRRRVARIMALALTGSALTGPPAVPASAAAAGTVLFNQPFHNSTANGTGAVALPALPGGTGTTNFACLTASGNTSTGVLRSCTTSTDSAGSGKLRLTNATTSKAGGVFSATSVPTSQGLDVAFNTYQYGGGGADGITFVLAAVDPANPQSPANIGQLGGALGYSASGGSSGLAYGYLGIGFDVYGNFSNSAYQGSGCTNPAYVGTGSVRVPGQVLVRGPGNGTVGYCALNSTATSTGSSALALRATARTAVPVQIGINPTGSVLTTAAGLAIPANSYRMVVTLVGGTTRTLTGALPSVASGLYPSSWLNASGIPRQLAFGWVASTGAVTDFHEIDEATVSAVSAVPELTVAQTSYSASTLSSGDPVTYSVVAGVAAGLPESSPVSITQTLPTGTVPVGAYGTGWVCDAPSGRSMTCTNGNGPFAAGAALPALTVVGVVTGGNVTPALVQSTTVATASSIDASPAYSSSTTAGTLPATPGGITVSPALGSIAGGTTVTVSGTNIANATAIEIGTTAQQEAGTPVVLLPCATGVTTGCFTINANGTLTVPSMPVRAANGAVNINVVTQGLDAAATYTYVASPGAPTATTAVAGVTSATVGWTAPASNGSAVTGYVVTPYINGVAQPTQTFNSNATTQAVTGPTPGTAYTFTVTAVNAAGPDQPSERSATATPNSPPAFTFPAPPAGEVGAAYGVPLTVGGGTAPYTWSVSAGSLPPGLTLNAATGVLSGTSTTTGGYPVTFRAVDANGQATTRAVTLVVMSGPLVVVKTASASSAVAGGTVGYTITVDNTGPSAFTGVTVNDALAGILDDAVYNGDATATSGSLSIGGSTLTWTGDLAVGASTTVTYTVTVRPPDPGDRSLAGTVLSGTPGNTCPQGNPGPQCTAVVAVLVPDLAITGSADVTTTTPGSVVRYTFTASNTGQTPYTGTSFTASLVGALDDATFDGDLAATSGSAVLAPDGTVTWTGDLAVGAAVTVTGSVTVKSSVTGDRVLRTSVTSAAPGSTCPVGNQAPACLNGVPVLVPGLTITKSADVSTTTPGSVVRYTIAVTNSGQTPYTGATVTDALAGVLDAAVYNGDAVATGGTVAYTEPVLTWTGALPVDAGAVVTFSVTVADPATGNAELDNQVTSATTGSTCPAGGTGPRCSVVTSVAATSMTLTGVTEEFTLTGPPNTTVRGEDVVTMTVVTNSVDGYTVTARAAATELVPVRPGVTAGIPVANLRVREHGTSIFRSLSTTDPVLVYDKPLPSAPGGDGISNDYEVDIPSVPTGRYTMTIDYIATAK
ncbi:beta strand repeat-containing protein [Streptosporangium canum]|uniref:beta strand repeat-containing protein n=1 Tax=Streptosporangium canum TaxID=324952 RepID=UPI0036A1AD98